MSYNQQELEKKAEFYTRDIEKQSWFKTGYRERDLEVRREIQSLHHRGQESGGGGWVSVEERLPNTNEDVLVWEKDDFEGDLAVARYTEFPSSEGGYWYKPFKNIQVTHWQPLPEPPIPSIKVKPVDKEEDDLSDIFPPESILNLQDSYDVTCKALRSISEALEESQSMCDRLAKQLEVINKLGLFYTPEITTLLNEYNQYKASK